MRGYARLNVLSKLNVGRSTRKRMRPMGRLTLLTTQQIGRAGELLVQYKLLLHGIDSAPMTTDVGIDLVAFSYKRSEAVTIQVKSNFKPKPGGGKGKPALDWWIPESNPSDLIALVDLSQSRVWLMTIAEIKANAQQHPKGRYHLYMYTDPATKSRSSGKKILDYEFSEFLLENRVSRFF